MLLGTAGYMSPEQARGKPVDRRADIWAFGCVLFEMLGGRKAFDGETVTDVLGAIVHKEPEVDKLPADVPQRIKGLIGRCLQKDQSRRLQSIGDARIALQEWIENPEADHAAVASGPGPGLDSGGLPWAAVFVAAVGSWLVARATVATRARPEPVRRSVIQVAEPPLDASVGSTLAVSPDGRHMAYVTGSSARKTLHLRPLDRFDTQEVADRRLP